MKETSSLHDKMIDGNWVLKRKRKLVSTSMGVSKEKESISLDSDSPVSKPSVKKKLIDDIEISQSHRIKGHDGYYFECEVCDLGGNLLCCDSCPRTYHLECLNPPLKRAPPGRWQCPSCCETKKDVKSSSQVDTSSKRKRTKSKLRKLSVHDNPLLSGKISTTQKHKSINKGKTFLSFRASSVENKSGYSQADMSPSPKSRSPASHSGSGDGISAIAGSGVQKNQDSSPISKASCHKEVHCNVDTLDMKNGSKGEGNLKRSERKRKKHVLSLVRCSEISKKGKHKTNGFDKKKRSRAHKRKHAAISESLHMKTSSNQQISASIIKKESTVLKLSVKKHPEISTLDAYPSAHGVDELGLNADVKAKYHENLLDEVFQVHRILGCRVQASIVKPSCHTQAIKSAVSSAVTGSVSDSEMIASVLPSSHVASENGHELLNETNDGYQVPDKGGAIAKAVHNEEIEDALAERKTYLIKDSDTENDVMKAKKLVTDQHNAQGICEFHEEFAVSVVNSADAADKVDSEENRDVRTVSVDDHGNHNLPVSQDSEVFNGKITVVQPDSSAKKRISAQSLQDRESKDGKLVSYEFLVKWIGQSNIHNSWISESQLKNLAKRKLENYKAKYGTALINICEEQWCEPQRVIAIRVSKDGTKEALIKWHGLPYDECTWERVDEPIIEKSAHLVTEFEELESQTLEKSAWDAIPRVKVEFQEVASLTEQPKELRGGSLFPHQLEALNWLRKCWHKSKNVILADEMGLGKTVSACAFISSLCLEFNAKLPCLVLVPLTTLPNWLAEFALWAPHLNVVEYHGHAKARSIIRQYEWHANELDRSRKITTSYKFNVLLTTYEMVLADTSHLRGVSWEVLIVDEGHRLKNSGSKLFGLLNTISFNHRVLLTGTPLQNNIGEMYNLLNFLQPVSFPSLSVFEEKFNDLTTAEKVEELKKLVAPHMLRRLKKDAMQNIPPKTERMVPVELTSIQAEYYRAMLTKNYQILRNAAKGGAQHSMLNIVMQLRKVCNHPYLVPGTEPESGSVEFLQEMRIKASAKLTLLHSMLKILHKEGHRVLIFSQMTKLLDILEDYLLIEFGPRTFERVDGSVAVADRQAAITRFNQDKSRFVFLLSTRSCGLGINLATADTVIIYDSDFNPHADIQAMNRAHRIGQSNRLLVYRLVVRASVEERILQLAKKKLMLDQLFVNKSESQKEVEDILRWGTEELFNNFYGVNEQDLKETSCSKIVTVTDGEHKHRRRSGGLGDVYQDRCTDSCTKIIWDENAILKLLDRTNLQSSVSESADGEMENDILGSVKPLDWNDELNDENGGIELLPILAGDTCEQSMEAKEDNPTNVTEENEWDKLLRLRWEQYQTEEEATLGRGKRLRKAISYKETFAPIPSEVLSEIGNEEDQPMPVYTPAGRALKEKYAKLRARQKERIAQRHNSEVLHSVNNTDLLREVQFASIKEAQSLDANKHTDDAREGDSPVNLEDTKISQPYEAKTSNSTDKLGRYSKHGCKSYHRTLLDLSGNPPENPSPDVLLRNHQLQSGAAANPMPPHLSPVLGLCAPNASQMNSMTRKSHSNRSRRRISSGMSEIPFPPPASSGPSNNLNIGEQEATGESSLFLDLSNEAKHRMKNVVQDNFFPLAPHSSGSFSSFQEILGLPNFEGNPFLAFPFPSKNAMKLQTDRLPNLSLGTNMLGSSKEFPNIPLVPKFSQHLSDNQRQKHKMEELPPILGLGQMHATQSPLPESHQRVLDNIMMRTQSAANKALNKRLKLETWTEDELDSLWIGVRRHGRGNWDAMLRDPKLKFSMNKTGDVLATRWIDEQQKIVDSPASKPDFLRISDGMMNRALFGSKFASIGSEPPKFRSHLTDIKLACGDRAPGFPFMEATNHRGSLNDSFLPLLPSWTPFHNPEKMNFPPEHRFKQNSNLVNEGEPSGSKKPKLPSFLDQSLNLLRDTHNSSKTDKLPHWLRDAVSVRPHLPPTVSAIAQSVRVLYGEEKQPTIPPFSIPGPPPSLPKDPRSSFKKKRKFDHAVSNVTRTDTHTPSLSLNLNSTSSSFDTQMKKSYEGSYGKQKQSMNSLFGCSEKLKDTSGDSSDTQSGDAVSNEHTSEHEP